MSKVVRQMVMISVAVFLAWPAVSENALRTDEGSAIRAPGAEERMGQAYVLITKADQARQEGNPKGAKEGYEEALGILDGLERDYPGWYSQVVRHRILVCESALEQIQDGTPAVQVDGVEPADNAGSNALAAVSFPLSAESAERVRRVLRAGSEERERTLSDLREEILDLKKQIRKLTGQLAMGEGKKASAGGRLTTYPDVLKTEVRRRIEAGSYSNAVALLNEMMVLIPEDLEVSRLLGVAYCRQGSFDEAVRVVEPLVKRGRAPADVWLTLGVAYLGIGNLGRARHAFEKALDRDPVLSDAHFNLAQILIRLKPPEAEPARRHYMTALQLGSTRDSGLETAINQALLQEQAQNLKR